MHRLALLFVTPLLAGLLSMPVRATSTERTAITQHKPTPTDSQIEATIRVRLEKSKIGKDGFRFHVQRGVVTWEGTTSVVQHKGSATRMARAAGAVEVINKIQISADGKAKTTASLKKAYVQQ